ncbi:hypothetical protein C8F01DRAFT_1363323 [Mycena amicta]|nr:hypothetical protein C8F01DRAFT_1363323 [Mycena amicta]
MYPYQHSRTESATSMQSMKEQAQAHSHPSTRRIAWPVYIVVGQVALMVLALGFLGAVRARDQIPMGKYAVSFFQENPQIKTYTFTTLANALSLFSSYLFTQAVRHALVVALTRPFRVSMLGFGVKISKKSLIVTRQYKWVVISVAIFLLGLGQTPSWSSLFTPNTIVVSVPLVGVELDLNSSSLQTDIRNLWDNILYPLVNDIEILPSLLGSGASSATSFSTGHPAILDFAGYTHAVSTGGILPVQLRTSDGSSQPDLFDVINTAPFPPSTNMSDVIMVMYQQGISANVSCQYSPFQNVFPPVSRKATPFGDFFVWDISTSCGNDQLSLTDNENNTLSMVACETFDTAGQPTFTAIVDAQGRYPGDFICTMSADVVDMVANYSSSTALTAQLQQGTSFVNVGPMGYAAFNATKNTFGYAQGSNGNIVGDTLLSVTTDQGSKSGSSVDVFARTLEAYMKGITELTGTIVKNRLAGYLASQNTLTADKTRPMTGFVTVQTLGWQYKTTTSSIVLIPIFFFALTTIAIALVAQYYNHGVPLNHADFDPNDPWLLMAAASAGGMTEVFHGVEDEDVEMGLQRRVMLGQFDGRDGFVQERRGEGI